MQACLLQAHGIRTLCQRRAERLGAEHVDMLVLHTSQSYLAVSTGLCTPIRRQCVAKHAPAPLLYKSGCCKGPAGNRCSPYVVGGSLLTAA